ncbi:MAG: biotin/lipoyl attachment protein [Bacillales bacterium]|jgi:HlyD family secretion protein|nr:biotin/lipoyl attachment protein [Bacillales bacterium]
MKKWIMIILIVTVGLIAALWFTFFRTDAASDTTNKTSYQTATVTNGTLDVKVSASGTLAIINDQDIKTVEKDTVKAVNVSVGQVVDAGTTLITFDNGADAIVAPFAGTVTTVEVAVDDTVQDNQVLFHLTDYTKLKTVISVDELDINKIKLSQIADITIGAIDGVTYQGTVTNIAAIGTNQNGVANFDVEITLNMNDNLKPGMSAEAVILIESKANALYLPIEAVQTANGKKYVESLDGNGDATQTEVTTGLINTNDVEILTGLSEGDTVRYVVATSSSNTFGPAGGMFMMGDGGAKIDRRSNSGGGVQSGK